MYGFPTPKIYQYLDTHDSFECSAFQCSTRVIFCSPVALRSLESRAQSETRLCSECLRKRNEGRQA